MMGTMIFLLPLLDIEGAYRVQSSILLRKDLMLIPQVGKSLIKRGLKNQGSGSGSMPSI